VIRRGAKYVDDTTIISVSNEPSDSSLQSASAQLCDWCDLNGMVINERKTKEMLIHFGTLVSKLEVPLVKINNIEIERVETFKLLGVVFSSDLSWNHHVSYMLNKISKRYYIIYQMVKVGVTPSDIITVYCSMIRSVLDYACPVWHCGLTQAQSRDIEAVQKRCLKIVFPDLSYNDALCVAGLERLNCRRERLVRELFNDMKNPAHILHDMLPLRHRVSSFTTRDDYLYELPLSRTMRYSRSFVPYCIRKRY
jgi:hypothetical protein